MSWIDIYQNASSHLMGTSNRLEKLNEYSNTLKSYDLLNRNMTSYQDTMNNWQDGDTYTMKTGNLGTGTQITLTNGQKAIKFSSGVYPLGINGFPDVQGKITDESLIPQ